MLLVVDSGNTNVVFAVYEGEEKRGQWRASSDPRRTPDEYAVWLTQLLDLDGIKPAQIDGAIISNVVPAAMRNLRVLCQRYIKVEPLVVEENSIAYGIPVRLDRPEQVGADRIANAVGAYARYGGPLIVVDFGTATTFDVIGADGGYDGGVIAPGINLSMDALYAAAARLPRIAVEKPQKVIGSDTVSAMQSGVFWGYIGLIEGLITRIQEEYGGKLTVVGTGGLAPLFAGTTAVIQESDADMTLRGLVLLYRRNTAS
ncbi:MAG: type III pantothenate kinase [Rhodovibrionaceae bacterium]